MDRLTRWNDRTEQAKLKDWDEDYWKDFMFNLDTVDWLGIYGAIDKLAEYEDLEEQGKITKVVRCRDCDVPHNKWTGCPKLSGLVTPPDFYCAFGRPKITEDIL